MKKLDRAKAFQDFINMSTEIAKITDPIALAQAYLVQIPDFLEGIYNTGVLEGIEEGKKQKTIEISRQN